MKRRLLFLWAILVTAAAGAQVRMGMSLGVTDNSYSIDTQYQYDWRYRDLKSECLLFTLQYDFSDWLGLRADLCPNMEKGYRMYRTGLFDKYDYTVYRSCLDMPVLAVFSFGGKRLRGYFGAGAFVSYCYYRFREGTVEDPVNPSVTVSFSETMEWNKERDNRAETGPAAVVGISLNLPQNLVLLVEGALDYALTSTTKNYMRTRDMRYNTTSAFHIGLQYCF